MPVCTHLDQIRVDYPQEIVGCEDCLKMDARGDLEMTGAIEYYRDAG
jgi:hypothetical protein